MTYEYYVALIRVQVLQDPSRAFANLGYDVRRSFLKKEEATVGKSVLADFVTFSGVHSFRTVSKASPP